MRKKLIAGNWKMNKLLADGLELVDKIKNSIKEKEVNCDVLIYPPFLLLHSISEKIKDSSILLGAQNCHWEEKGAFTGEVSPSMIADIGCDYVLIGHSERRTYFNETNEILNKKIKAGLKAGLKVMYCVGELLEEREKGETEKVVINQIEKGLENISNEEIKNISIAYEPVWAIGTGKTATPEQAEEVHALIRDKIKKLYGEEIAEKIRILYGGSVNPSNVKDLMGMKNIDGALIGGASLKFEDFNLLMRFDQ